MDQIPDHPVIQHYESTGYPDSEEQPLFRCAQCGREGYPGENYYTDTPAAPDDPGAVTLHQDCLMDWVRDRGPSAVAEAFGFARKESNYVD